MKSLALSLLLAQAPPAAPPYRLDYTIAMPDLASHLYSITLTASGVSDSAVDLQMPVWSPGRYGRMDFAKNVQQFTAIGGGSDGKPPRWTKTNGSLWGASPGASRARRVRYGI